MSYNYRVNIPQKPNTYRLNNAVPIDPLMGVLFFLRSTGLSNDGPHEHPVPWRFAGGSWDILLGDLECTGNPHLGIIPASKWLVTPIYKSWKGLLEGEQPILRRFTITMVINNLLTGMILQACPHPKRRKMCENRGKSMNSSISWVFPWKSYGYSTGFQILREWGNSF